MQVPQHPNSRFLWKCYDKSPDGSSYSTIGAMHTLAERVGGVNDIDSIQDFPTRTAQQVIIAQHLN